MQKASLRELSSLCFRIGNSTFGSGGTIIILLARTMIARGWISKGQSDLYFTLARVVPGTNVLAYVASASWAVRGWPGVMVALLALSIPASVIMIGLTLAYQQFQHSRLGGEFITAAMSAIVGVIVSASFMIAVPAWRLGSRVRTAVLVAGAALASRWLGPIEIVAIAAAIGYFWHEPESPRQ